MSSGCSRMAMEERGRLTRFHFLQARDLIARERTPKLQNPWLHSSLLHDFLNCCLQGDEDRRASAQELLQVKREAAAGGTAVPRQGLLLG